jgi:cytochrome c556
VPFDLVKVQATLKVIQEQSTKLKSLFPDDSKTGDTETLPVAFEKKADVIARFDKLVSDAKEAEGSIKDEASFKAGWGKIGGNCGGCHKEYRKPS